MGQATLVAVGFCFFVGANVFAQSTEPPIAGSSSTSLSAEVPLSAPSGFKIHGELGTETLQYPTAIIDRPQLSQNNVIEAAAQMDFENSWAMGRLQFQGQKSTNLNSQYLAVQEAYAGTAGGRGLYLGRKINFWNQADEDWNLGLWQPLQTQDGLRPIPQGLTGLFYNYESSAFQVLAFGSPVFIPSMSPDFVEQDGALVSDNRWFRSLPQRVSVMDNHQTELVYHLRVPATRELVMQPGYGLRLRAGLPDRGPWMSAAFARKPINALMVKYDASVIARSTPAGNVDVAPVVYQHEIWSADLGWRFENSDIGISYLRDLPEVKLPENTVTADGFQTDYYQQQPRPVQLMSVHLSSKGFLPVVRREIAWKLLYLRAHTEPTTEFDAQGVERSAFIPYRLNFTHAAVAQATVLWTSRFQTEFKYLREFDQLGSIWNFEMQYKISSVALRLGVDVLGVDDEVAQESDNRFINAYRQNDRVYGGLSYVF